MKKNLSAVYLLGLGVATFITICLLCRICSEVLFIFSGLQDLKYIGLHPEYAPARSFTSADGFSLLWTNTTEAGNAHRVFTQLFTIDDKNLIYATRYSLNSVDIHTGEQLWSVSIPEDAVFHLYNNQLFTLNDFDETIPFAPEAGIHISGDCAYSTDTSSLSVYDPHSGQIIWELSYHLVSPSDIYFHDASAYMSGLTMSNAKYISTVNIDIYSGKILNISCENWNHYSRPSNDEGILSAGFYPITSEYDWNKKDNLPFFLAEGSKLKMLDRENRQLLGSIEFSGFSLSPQDTQLILQNGLLIVYLDDSDQFFAFQMK